MMTIAMQPPHHIVRRGGKDCVIERRPIHVETYGMDLDYFQRQIKIALEDEDVAADDVRIVFGFDYDYDQNHTLTCELTWYRPATDDDKRENREWDQRNKAVAAERERERVKQFVESNPALAKQVLAEIELAEKNNKGGRG